MTQCLIVLWIISGGAVLYIQLKNAWTNYPEGKAWFLLRFGSAFFNGIVLGVLLFHKDYHGAGFIFPVLLVGFANAILFTFAFQHNLQYLIPKRNSSGKDIC